MKKNVSIIFLIFTITLLGCQEDLLDESPLAEEISSINIQNIANEFEKASDVHVNLRKESFSPFKYEDFITAKGNADEPDYETGDGYYFTSQQGCSMLYCAVKDNAGYAKYVNRYVWGGEPYMSGQMKTNLLGYETENTKILCVRNDTKIDLYVYDKKSETLKSIPAKKIGVDFWLTIKILKKNILIIETWDFVRAGQYHAYIIIDTVTGEYYNFPIKGSSSQAEYEPRFRE